MSEDSSNTAQNSTPDPEPGTEGKKIPGRPFQKNDARINRKGRPKSFDALRQLAQQIAHEGAMAGGQEIIINGHRATVAEMILRNWALSRNPVLQKAFMEVAFGKVPETTSLQGDKDHPLEVVFRYTGDPEPGSEEDTE